MNIKGILLIIVLVVLLYIVIKYLISDVNTLSSSILSGTQMQTITADKLPLNGSGPQASNFTYSIWFYVQDWNYKYGELKTIFGRMGSSTSTSSSSSTESSSSVPECLVYNSSSPDSTSSSLSSDISVLGSNPCPLVTLGALTNDLAVSLSVFSPSMPGGTSTFTCSVPNVPIQKWVNLVTSVYGRSLDVYLDGKLVKTCVLPGLANINANANLYITPNGGFSGWTSKFQYYPNAINPQTAWNIYKAGYGSSLISSVFGNYQIKVSFLENGNQTSSVTI